MKSVLSILLFWSYNLFAQNNVYTTAGASPNMGTSLPGGVAKVVLGIDTTTGAIVKCWGCGTGGSSGTVTSFSAGTLSPLFTTGVATSTTTPALSFTLSNAGSNTVFANISGGSATPSFTLAATQIPGMITSGTDNLSVANANTTCVNYTFTDVNYHTAELGVALSVNSISGGAILTVSASWENAQNSGTESYTWPTVSASGYSGILLIPVTAYKSHAITVTVTWNSAGAVNYNANGIYRQIR